MLRVEMLSTGDEVLHGQIIDTNSAWLSDYLFQHGLPLTTRSTAGDNLESLVEMLTLRSRYADILIVNGGLGPTKDDLSADAAAIALGVELEERTEWIERMQEWFAKRDRKMADSNLKQAMLPKGAELVDNPVGSACGFSIILNECLIFFTPGVPSEFKVMVQQQILPRLRQDFLVPKAPICLRLTTFGRSESQLAQNLNSLDLPETIVLGYRSASPIIEIKLTGPAEEKVHINNAWQKIKETVGQNIIYEGVTSLAHEIARLLNDKGLTIAINEQFTAGLLGLQLNNANAPVKGGRYFPSDFNASLSSLSTIAVDTKSEYGSDLSLIVGHKEGNNIYLALSTTNATYAICFHYSSHSYSLETQQQTIAMLMLDTLRRWLNGWTVVGNYEWIEAAEVESSYR